MTKHRVVCMFLGVVVLMGTLLAFQRTRVFINGKETQEVMVSGGKTYVSVAALREAGAAVTVSGNRVDIQFDPLVGRMQGDMVEGRIGEWLHNGTWRVRVSTVESIKNPFGPGPGFALTVEFRNLTTKTISLHNSGIDKFLLYDDQGNKLSVALGGDYDRIYNSIVQADGFTAVLRFGDPNNQIREVGQPDKLLIQFRPSGGAAALKGFRIFLKEDTTPEILRRTR